MAAVETKVTGHIGYVILNRPESLNAMNGELVEGFHAGLTKLLDDEAVRVIILTGAGRAFCAGGDLAYMETMTEESERQTFIARVGEMALRINRADKPVIAMVNGVTAGAGVNIMLACDMVCAVDSAKFIQSFVNVGLIPDCGGLYFLPRVVGKQRAKELMYTARPVKAEEALALGMVTFLYDSDTLVSETEALAVRIAAGSPGAIRAMKHMLAEDTTLEEVLAREARVQARRLGGDAYAEGVAAFKEKRSPRFTDDTIDDK